MPQAIGLAILGAEIGSEVIVPGLTVADVVGSLVVEGLAIGASALLAPGAPTPQTQKVNIKSPVSPRRRGYGAAKIGGTLAVNRP